MSRAGLLPAVVGLAALTGAVAVCALHPPVPQAHDEFSHLLAADTFRHGRLANPPHPAWPWLESFHILQQPTYASKEPPLQGAILALGMLLGDPVRGVWLCWAAACAALTWMLQAWVGPRWALLGGLLFAVQPQLVTEWGATLWGGAAPMLGAALVYGAVPRLVAHPRTRDAVALGAGAAILALSRPFEGLVACLPAAFLLLRRGRPGSSRRAGRLRVAALPLAGTLLPALAFQALLDQRVTGDPLRLPYLAYMEQYRAAPPFLFGGWGPPADYRHAVMRRYLRDIEAHPYVERRTPGGYAKGLVVKLLTYGSFFLMVSFSLALLALVGARDEPGVKFGLAAGALFGLALAVQTYEHPHYAAPFTPVLAFLLVVALRRIWRARGGWGRIAVPALLVLAFTEHAAVARLALAARAADPLNLRPRIIEALETRPGKHLVIVRYAPHHNPHSEWVYNEADIDAARVVWAREMEPERNRELLRHFPERTAWLLTPDVRGSRLRRYEPGPP